MLLLVIDRLQGQTEPRIISACEMVIRATEACVATLDADYQVSTSDAAMRFLEFLHKILANFVIAEISTDSSSMPHVLLYAKFKENHGSGSNTMVVNALQITADLE